MTSLPWYGFMSGFLGAGIATVLIAIKRNNRDALAVGVFAVLASTMALIIGFVALYFLNKVD